MMLWLCAWVRMLCTIAVVPGRAQSRGSTSHSTWTIPAALMSARTFGFEAPYGGRKQVDCGPSKISWCRLAAETAVNCGCEIEWLPIVLPAARTAPGSPGCALCLAPSSKNVACPPYLASTCRTCGVHIGSGPSSKLRNSTFLLPVASAAVGFGAGSRGVDGGAFRLGVAVGVGGGGVAAVGGHVWGGAGGGRRA